MPGCTESRKSLVYTVMYLRLISQLRIFGVSSTVSSVKRGIMKNCSYSVMAVTKAATHTAINPRSLQYLMATGFVPLV